MRSENSLLTLTGSLRKVRSVNESSNGFRTLLMVHAQPNGTLAVANGAMDVGTATGASILVNAKQGTTGQNGVLLLPYGLQASVDNKTMSMRVYAWHPVGEDTQSTLLWKPTKLIEVACTLTGTDIGVALMTLIATEGMADTITLTGTTANANVGCEIVSPADNTGGHIVLDLKGAPLWEVTFTTGGSATSCNCLYAYL